MLMASMSESGDDISIRWYQDPQLCIPLMRILVYTGHGVQGHAEDDPVPSAIGDDCSGGDTLNAPYNNEKRKQIEG